MNFNIFKGNTHDDIYDSMFEHVLAGTFKFIVARSVYNVIYPSLVSGVGDVILDPVRYVSNPELTNIFVYVVTSYKNRKDLDRTVINNIKFRNLGREYRIVVTDKQMTLKLA